MLCFVFVFVIDSEPKRTSYRENTFFTVLSIKVPVQIVQYFGFNSLTVFVCNVVFLPRQCASSSIRFLKKNLIF